jgi:ubiquinone/menaquinone biosynthesis C-methylase UbiE
MKKFENDLEIFSQITEIKEKTIIDVGCGTGGFVRELAAKGARVIGIDYLPMLTKSKNNQPLLQKSTKDSQLHRLQKFFIAGAAENLPLKDNYADIIVFFASFHHILETRMDQSLQETYRVLKTDGLAIFLEPIGQKGSYFEIVRLIEDERSIQQIAFQSIKNAHMWGLENKKEEIAYFERSFGDYANLVKVFVDDEIKRKGYLKNARKITTGLSKEAGIPFEDYRYKSICRVNVLQKSR